MPRILLSLLAILCIGTSAFSQNTIKGIVYNTNKEALSFTNIGIKHKNVGTISSEDGSFSIAVPPQYVNDTLSFSIVGYHDLSVPIRTIIQSGQTHFELNQNVSPLKEVSVVARKLEERKIGIKNYNPILHFNDGSTNQNDIFEIAQLIHLENSLSKITSLNLRINDDRRDSGIFRINFYGFDGKRPANRIVDKNITQVHRIKEGWLRFDLSKHNIYLKGDVVVAIEFIPAKKENNKPIVYEVKLGGRTKSFVRTSSLGEWSVPPHHYRMFITALCESDKNSKINDEEEKGSDATVRLYSQHVADSFSIFIHLPKNYSRSKKGTYPVMVLLDANAYFDMISGALDDKGKNAPRQEPILAGIGYKDAFLMNTLRDRDFTYPIALPADSMQISGGAMEFRNFIEDELLPYIDKNYKIDKNECSLMGHSLAGYFVLWCYEQDLLNKNRNFRNYVAASPSLLYHNGYLEQELKSISEKNRIEKKLLITMGGMEDAEDGLTDKRNERAFNSFIDQFELRKINKTVFKHKIYDKYVHMETAVPSFSEGLDFITE